MQSIALKMARQWFGVQWLDYFTEVALTSRSAGIERRVPRAPRLKCVRHALAAGLVLLASFEGARCPERLLHPQQEACLAELLVST
jgi:hypothetical protein